MSDTDNIYTKLAAIQQSIKVPKDLDNSFAGFKYRSAESIIEKLKPLLDKHKVTVILNDDVVELAGQVYVRGTATLIDCAKPDDRIPASAYAREEKQRPKMSEGQLTGAASSYARKYALNGLLLLDDNKDPDSQDNTPLPKQAAYTPRPATKPSANKLQMQRGYIKAELHKIGVADEDMHEYIKTEYGYDGISTQEQAEDVLERLRKLK